MRESDQHSGSTGLHFCCADIPDRAASRGGDRHNISQTVRAEVTAKSQDWGYQLGSVYIRKVHFRDAGMIKQIEEKVVNRLRQVTSAIKQAGANQVSVTTSSAEREAAIEFAKAAAIRPGTLGKALVEIAREPAVAEALFAVLETQRILAGGARFTQLPSGPHSRILADLLATDSSAKARPPSTS